MNEVWAFGIGIVLGAGIVLLVQFWDVYQPPHRWSYHGVGAPESTTARNEHDTILGELDDGTRYVQVEPRCTCTWISTTNHAPQRIDSPYCPVHGTGGIGRGPRFHDRPEDPEHD